MNKQQYILKVIIIVIMITLIATVGMYYYANQPATQVSNPSREVSTTTPQQATQNSTQTNLVLGSAASASDVFFTLPPQQKVFEDPYKRYSIIVPEGYVYNFQYERLYLWTLPNYVSGRKEYENNNDMYKILPYDFSIDSLSSEDWNYYDQSFMSDPQVRRKTLTVEDNNVTLYGPIISEGGDYLEMVIPAKGGVLDIIDHRDVYATSSEINVILRALRFTQ